MISCYHVIMIKRIALITIVSGLLTACGEGTHIDADLYSYALKFQQEAAKHGKPVSITSLDIVLADQGEDGVCIRGGGSNAVRINKKKFSQWSEDVRTGVIFHELGHCLLDREHTEVERASFGGPTSLMHPFVIGVNNYLQENWDFYMGELFGSN